MEASGFVGPPLKVLIVEDEPLVVLNLRDILEGMGLVPVDTAARGRVALALALVERPDLLFMDVGLAGDMDGITAAETIVSALRIPVVFYSGKDGDVLRARAEAIPNAVFLPKPADADRIRSAVHAALALSTGLGAELTQAGSAP